MCVCMCVSRWMWMHYVWACKHTHNADDYNSTLLGDSSTIVERSRLSELWSNNSPPLPLYKRIQYGHIYHYCSPCAQLASCYLEWVLEINPAKLCFAQTTLQVMIILSLCFLDSLYINCSLWYRSDSVRLTHFLPASWQRELCLICLSAVSSDIE